MTFSGMNLANQKGVYVQYNPGWGEPGEWYLDFSNREQRTIDDVSGMGPTQEAYLERLSADKYRDAVIESNWKNLGDADDVVKVVLDYLGYNDDNREEDQKRIDFAAGQLKALASNIIEALEAPDFSVHHIKNEASTLSKELNDSAEFIEAAQHRIRVYDAVKAGEKVGLSWSNETFLRDFPKSPIADRIRELTATK